MLTFLEVTHVQFGNVCSPTTILQWHRSYNFAFLCARLATSHTSLARCKPDARQKVWRHKCADFWGGKWLSVESKHRTNESIRCYSIFGQNTFPSPFPTQNFCLNYFADSQTFHFSQCQSTSPLFCLSPKVHFKIIFLNRLYYTDNPSLLRNVVFHNQTEHIFVKNLAHDAVQLLHGNTWIVNLSVLLTITCYVNELWKLEMMETISNLLIILHSFVRWSPSGYVW